VGLRIELKTPAGSRGTFSSILRRRGLRIELKPLRD
jgi:hypothetical protein